MYWFQPKYLSLIKITRWPRNAWPRCKPRFDWMNKFRRANQRPFQNFCLWRQARPGRHSNAAWKEIICSRGAKFELAPLQLIQSFLILVTRCHNRILTIYSSKRKLISSYRLQTSHQKLIPENFQNIAQCRPLSVAAPNHSQSWLSRSRNRRFRLEPRASPVPVSLSAISEDAIFSSCFMIHNEWLFSGCAASEFHSKCCLRFSSTTRPSGTRIYPSINARSLGYPYTASVYMPSV